MSRLKKMFVERLIIEVENSPLLWNKYEEHYNNRSVTDKEWARIGTALNRDKDKLKQKWRNLRDQFLKEAKKIKIPTGSTEPLENYYKGKWMFFNHLIFLKKYVSAKNKRSNSFSDQSEDEEDTQEEYLQTEFEQSLSPIPGPSRDGPGFDDTNNSDANDAKSEPMLDPKIEIEPESVTKNDRKRKAEESPSKAVKRIVVESNENVSDIDEDLYFVKSLVPSLKRLNPIRKLLIRNEIQNLLLRELMCERCRLYGNQKVCQCNPL